MFSVLESEDVEHTTSIGSSSPPILKFPTAETPPKRTGAGRTARRVNFSEDVDVLEFVVLTKHDIKLKKREEERVRKEIEREKRRMQNRMEKKLEKKRRNNSSSPKFAKKRNPAPTEAGKPEETREKKKKGKEKPALKSKTKEELALETQHKEHLRQKAKEAARKRTGASQEKKNQRRSKKISSAACLFVLGLLGALLAYYFQDLIAQKFRSKEKKTFSRSTRVSRKKHRKGFPWVYIESPVCHRNAPNGKRKKRGEDDQLCIAQSKTFVIASGNFKETKRKNHFLYIDGIKHPLGSIIEKESKKRPDGSLVFSLTLAGLSGGVHNATVTQEELWRHKPNRGNSAISPDNYVGMVRSRDEISFQVDRSVWIDSLQVEILKPLPNEVTQSNQVSWKTTSFKVPDDGTVFFRFRGQILKVNQALGSVNVNGVLPGRNHLVIGMMDHDGRQIGATAEVSWTFYEANKRVNINGANSGKVKQEKKKKAKESGKSKNKNKKTKGRKKKTKGKKKKTKGKKKKTKGKKKKTKGKKKKRKK
jgi:hypothetical protein